MMTNEQLAEIDLLATGFRAAMKEWDDEIPANYSYAIADLTCFLDSNGTPICNALDMLIAEVRRLQAERPKLCYQLDHASTAIGYAVEAIDSDDVISAHARLTSAQTIIENADAHKDEWNAYR